MDLVELKGYLRKKSRHDRWQRRYFEATTHYLTYYKNQESEKLLACIDLWRTQTIDFLPMDEAKLEFSIAIGEQSYLLKADDKNDAERWVKGLQARQHRPEGTPSDVFSLRSERMDAESDASTSEYGGRRSRNTSSDPDNRRLAQSYTDVQNPVVPNAAAIARLSQSHADAPYFMNARASSSVTDTHDPFSAHVASTGPKFPMLTPNQQITQSTAPRTKKAEEKSTINAQCCVPCAPM
ncbi:hypothetical protein CCR75_005018 [Bremia lactucae]|uniref:PH domain-containing protein n=1 Tax=Bremia lactucae TaxID=4779 RepID=A0A976FMI1_BRELC|nr:hypothetical protein CCR75_005018 [Bremia lactucae]